MLAAVVGSCQRAVEPAKAASVPQEGSPPHAERRDDLVQVRAGLRLHLRCEGRGAPIVVFDSGLGLDGEYWHRGPAPLAAATSRFTRACTYDRAGRGRSDPAQVPHRQSTMARELHDLLANAGEPAPYVLVGHSMGGVIAQFLLAQHPASVAGMVLIDSSPEPPPLTQIAPEMLAEWERNITRLEGLERESFMQGFEELRSSQRTLADKPLVVLVAGRALPTAGADSASRSQLEAQQRAQRQLVALSTNSVSVTAEYATHNLPYDAPTLVLESVRAVVLAARRHTQLDAKALRQAAAPP
ncbi:MAG TPA: alpha/beta hydrolase [Polyangiaceae bacterium]|nr:alpha/beta hydrolase [Polyangiaceae bacterium]